MNLIKSQCILWVFPWSLAVVLGCWKQGRGFNSPRGTCIPIGAERKYAHVPHIDATLKDHGLSKLIRSSPLWCASWSKTCFWHLKSLNFIFYSMETYGLTCKAVKRSRQHRTFMRLSGVMFPIQMALLWRPGQSKASDTSFILECTLGGSYFYVI